jgi:hypothetical protein
MRKLFCNDVDIEIIENLWTQLNIIKTLHYGNRTLGGKETADYLLAIEAAAAGNREITRLKQLDGGNFYPLLDLLEERLREGFTLGWLDGKWRLFNNYSDVHCSGNDIRDLMANLILTDC